MNPYLLSAAALLFVAFSDRASAQERTPEMYGQCEDGLKKKTNATGLAKAIEGCTYVITNVPKLRAVLKKENDLREMDLAFSDVLARRAQLNTLLLKIPSSGNHEERVRAICDDAVDALAQPRSRSETRRIAEEARAYADSLMIKLGSGRCEARSQPRRS